MNIQIIVDSCCDVTDALRNVLSLSLASLKITVGEHFYEDDGTIDTVSYTHLDVYKRQVPTFTTIRIIFPPFFILHIDI